MFFILQLIPSTREQGADSTYPVRGPATARSPNTPSRADVARSDVKGSRKSCSFLTITSHAKFIEDRIIRLPEKTFNHFQ